MQQSQRPQRLFDIMSLQASERPLPDSVAAKIDGEWRRFSSTEVIAIANDLSMGLVNHGIGHGDRIAIISANRPEWVFADLAILQLGAIVVPVYPNATAADYAYILNHSKTRLVFAADASISAKLLSIRADLPHLEAIYTFDRLSTTLAEAAVAPLLTGHWRELAEIGATSGDLDALQRSKAQVQHEDLASIIYTSGTTGTPKGVMLSHGNILASLLAVKQVMPKTGLRRALSFLPLSHILERSTLYFYQHASIATYFAESLDTILPNLREVRPQVMVSVPRLLEKIYEGFVAKGHQLTGAKRALFDWALLFAKAYNPEQPVTAATERQLQLATHHVFRHWRLALGGELSLATVGGSALPPHLGRVFWTAGIQLLEGYGLTENSPVITSNTPAEHRLGTVGVPLPTITVKIQQEPELRPGEGEILVKGPTVMQGYYLDPCATSEAIDADGWLHTGDIGILEDGGFLRITDRKKEMFKTSGGKYIAPLALESKFKESPLIAQMLVVGENRKFAAALIVPEFKALREWCELNHVAFTSHGEMVKHPDVIACYSAEIRRLNQHFGSWEQIKEFRLLADEWSINSGELTPKLSMRRRVITAGYRDLIDSIYAL